MNLYIRYFDDEVVVTSVEDALQFIAGIQGFVMTPQFEEDFRQYVEGPMPYPKRYKVRARIYFIVIKTTASTLADFKANGKGAVSMDQTDSEGQEATHLAPDAALRQFMRPKELATLRLTDEEPGWYDATMKFKRVVQVPQTGKFDYQDAVFSARLKAYSGLDCYNRIVDHLRTRADIDPRSQFPSAKGKNFRFNFLGLKPYSELNI